MRLRCFGASPMVRAVRVAHLAIAVALAALGCNKGSAGQTATSASPSASAAPAAAASGAVRAPKNKPLAREKIDVPGGAFEAGSVPGSPGRNPELEPVAKQVDLGAYQIDRLPYPNDPGQPPLTAVTRDEAKRKCAERGQRLCTELEWERACRGPDSELYPTGAGWDPRCADEPRTCASGFDVLGLAAALREWTASDVVPEKGKRTASVRGANQKAPALEHRCAARHALDPEEKADDLGFRCCGGAPNAAVVKEPRLEQTFQKVHLTAERVEKLFAQDPHTSVIAKDIKFFREPDAANTVIERGPGDKKGFLFTVEPMIWNPVAGSEFLVFVGRSGKDTSFVVTYHVVGKDDYQLASSFIMKNEPGPVALAYSGYIRPRLHFSTCWGCPGETGKILHRDPDDVVIVQP